MENNTPTAKYDIEIAEFNSTGIQDIARELGATYMRSVASGTLHGNSDASATLYALSIPGGEFLVLDTNADPVSEVSSDFSEALEEYGIDLEAEDAPAADQAIPEYIYELNGVDDMTRKAIIYVTAKLDGKEAFALFTVDANGAVECDASGDNCEENPFEDGWPEPSAKLIAEAKEMAVEY